MHFEIPRKSERFVAVSTREWLMCFLVMILQRFFILVFHFAQLALERAVVDLHVSLEMIFRCNFFVANLASVDRNVNPMKATMTNQQLLVDEALLTILVVTLERLVSRVRRY